MKFSLCFCFKRDRATYNLSPASIYYTNSNSRMPTVTLAPLPYLSDRAFESDYEKIIDSSGDGEINDRRDSIASMEYRGYEKVKPIKSQPVQSFDDNTALYATVNKTRTGNNGLRITTNTPIAIDAAVRQISSPTLSTTSSSLQAIFPPSLHLPGIAITSEHPPPLPPPHPRLLPLPVQVHPDITVNGITNDHNTSRHRPHYDEVIMRECLQYRAQRLQMEEQQLRENYYSSVNSEPGTTNSSDLYAEIANGSASGTVYQNPQYHYYSRPSNGSGIGDDLSERYATVIETNNTSEQPTTNRIYQEVDSLMF